MRYGEIVAKGLRILSDAGIEHWLNLGAETQSQNRLNREHMDSLTFEMRLLGDGKWADTRTTLFGVDLPVPIMPAALTASRVINKLAMREEPWLELFASGVAKAGSVMWVGMSTTGYGSWCASCEHHQTATQQRRNPVLAKRALVAGTRAGAD